MSYIKCQRAHRRYLSMPNFQLCCVNNCKNFWRWLISVNMFISFSVWGKEKIAIFHLSTHVLHQKFISVLCHFDISSARYHLLRLTCNVPCKILIASGTLVFQAEALDWLQYKVVSVSESCNRPSVKTLTCILPIRQCTSSLSMCITKMHYGVFFYHSLPVSTRSNWLEN